MTDVFYTVDRSLVTHEEVCHQHHMTALCVAHSLDEKLAQIVTHIFDTNVLEQKTRTFV